MKLYQVTVESVYSEIGIKKILLHAENKAQARRMCKVSSVKKVHHIQECK